MLHSVYFLKLSELTQRFLERLNLGMEPMSPSTISHPIHNDLPFHINFQFFFSPILFFKLFLEPSLWLGNDHRPPARSTILKHNELTESLCQAALTLSTVVHSFSLPCRSTSPFTRSAGCLWYTTVTTVTAIMLWRDSKVKSLDK